VVKLLFERRTINPPRLYLQAQTAHSLGKS